MHNCGHHCLLWAFLRPCAGNVLGLLKGAHILIHFLSMTMLGSKKKIMLSSAQWLMPVPPSTQQSEVGGFGVGEQPRLQSETCLIKVSAPSQFYGNHGTWLC